MGRSVSFDLLADGTQASAELVKVGKEVASLGEKIQKASGTVKVDADTARALQQIANLDSQLGRLNARSLRLDVDQAAAERQLQILKVELDKATGDRKIKVQADIDQAEARIRHLAGERISINLDVAGAGAKLDALKAKVGDLGDDQGGGGLTRLRSGLGSVADAIGSVLSRFGPLTIAVAASAGVATIAAVAFAGLGMAVGLAAVAGGGLAAVAAGFTGIGDAVSAMGQKSDDGGAKARSAADAISSAARSVESAERSLRSAQETERQSTLDLTQARRDAASQLQDLQRRTEDMASAQEDADLSVREARAHLDEVMKDSKSTTLEKERATLSLHQAELRLKETNEDAAALAEKKNTADKKGVEGSDLVVQAQARVQAAHEATGVAADQLTDAQHRLAEAQHPIASGIDTVAQAMANLGPKGQAFATYLRGFVDGPLKQLRLSGQEAFLPGIQTGLQALTPIMAKLQPAFAAFSGQLGKTLGGLIPLFGSMAKPFLDFATASLQGLAPLQPVLQLFATQLGAVFEQLTKSGVAKAAMEGFVKVLGALLPVLPPLIDAGAKIAAALGPSLAVLIDQLVKALVSMLPAIVSLAPFVGQLVVALAPLLPAIALLVPPVVQLLLAFSPLIPVIAQLVAQIATLIAQLITALMPALLPIVTAIAQLATAILGPLIGAISALLGWVIGQLAPGFKQLGEMVATSAQYVRDHWQGVLDWFKAIPGTLAGWWNTAWDGIKTGASAAGDWIVDKWNGIMNWFAGIPGWISRTASGMWNGVRDAFRSALNTVIGWWNSLRLTLGGFSWSFMGWNISIPNFTLGTWPINYLAAGGVATKPTLAMIGEGGEPEAVVPLSKAGSMGFGGGGATFNTYITGTIGNEEYLTRTIVAGLESAVRRGTFRQVLVNS